MVSTIASCYQLVTQPCYRIWENSFPVRHKVSRISQGVFDCIIPRSSLPRYLLTDLAPKTIKLGTIAGGCIAAPIALIYGLNFIGHQTGSLLEYAHDNPFSYELLYDVILGTCTMIPVGALAGSAIFLLLDGKKAIPALLFGGLLTTAALSAAVANWTIGHYLSEYVDGKERHSNFHKKAGLIYEITMDSIIGMLPTAVFLTIGTGGAMCATIMALELRQLMHAELKHYKDWRTAQQQLIEMEEGKDSN